MQVCKSVICKSTCRYRTCLRMPFPPVQHRPSAEDYPFLAGSSDLKLASTWFPEVTTADCHRPLRGRSKTVPTLETCWKSPVSMSKAHHASSSALRLVKALGHRCTMLCCTIASSCKRTYSNDPSCIRIESSISEQVLSCPVSSSFYLLISPLLCRPVLCYSSFPYFLLRGCEFWIFAVFHCTSYSNSLFAT